MDQQSGLGLKDLDVFSHSIYLIDSW